MWAECRVLILYLVFSVLMTQHSVLVKKEG